MLKKALQGKSILVTRAADQAGLFAGKLKQHGARVIECPLICIQAPNSWRSLDRALKNLSNFDWLIFTSANGVYYFAQRYKQFYDKPLTQQFKNLRVFAIGPATAQSLKKNKIKSHQQAQTFVSEGILEYFAKNAEQKILIVRAQKARTVLPQGLRQMGAQVQLAIAYQTLPNVAIKKNLQKALQQADCITFTSASTVNNFFALADKKFLEKICVASIGPITSAALKKFKVAAHVQAKQSTTDALTRSLVKFYSRETTYEKK